MLNIARSAALALAVAAGLHASTGHAVGRFAYVDGGVTVREGSGATRAARAGERVNEGDAVHTGNGRAQIRFDDKGWVFLQPSTVFEVRQYSEKETSVAMSLLKGSLRAVTGLIGNRNPSRFRVETTVATIGIRGTSFQATFCAQSCNVPDGLYVTGGDGTTFLRNPLGEIDLSRGRTGYVASLQTAPAESNVKPVAEVAPPVSSEQMASAGSTQPGELRPGNFVYFEGASFTPPFTVRNITSAGGGLAGSGLGSATATVLLKGTTTIRSESITDTGIAGGAGKVLSNERLSVTLDAAQRPVNLTGSSGADLISITALTVPEIAFSSDNILYWGRWTRANFFVNVQAPGDEFSAFGTLNVPGGSYLHYIFGIPSATVPLTGSATYSILGGTGSTSLSGTLGDGMTAGTFTANFGSNLVSASGLKIDHGGTYSVTSASAALASGNRAQFTGSSTASGPGGSFPFKFDGFFAGAPAPVAPPRAGMVWTIERPDAIVGATAFRCSSGC